METKLQTLKKLIRGPVKPKSVTISDVAREIPGTLKKMGQNIYNGVDPAGLAVRGIKGVKSLAKSFNSRLEAGAEHKRNDNIKLIEKAGGTVKGYLELQKKPLLKKKTGNPKITR